MSILHLVRCECYEHCKQEYSFGANTLPGSLTPDTWIALFEGNPRTSEGYHFCSKECLAQWLESRGIIPTVDEEDDLPDEFLPFRGKCLSDGRVVSLSDGTIYIPEPQEQLDCKARRFLLVDGETADITEGVKWQDGSVTLDGGGPSYASWDELKATREGSGVQWIDQEASK